MLKYFLWVKKYKRWSDVIYQIRTNIFKRLHISGFQSVGKSREMIKALVIKNVNTKLSESKD